MDYLMGQCKNKIDIWQRDLDGHNGLHLAVKNQRVSMVKYLLDNVYTTDEMKRKVFNQTIGINDMHISLLAANTGTTQDGLVIFKLLKENKCQIHNQTIEYAASYSSLILDYMLNEKLYTNLMHLSNDLIDITVANARVHLVHKNLLMIVKYLNSMTDTVSINEYRQWIINVFYNIMMSGTMDGYFKMLKEMIVILLNNEQLQQPDDCDWKCFTKSQIIDAELLMKLKDKMDGSTNTQDIADSKWCILLKDMIDSFKNDKILSKYDGEDETAENKSDSKEDAENNGDNPHCTKNHSMLEMSSKNNTHDTESGKKCNCCSEFKYTNVLSFECVECGDYICQECSSDLIKLNQYLENEGFQQFETMMNQCSKIKQENMIKQVEFCSQMIKTVCQS